MKNQKFLEEFYEKVILSKYDCFSDVFKISWVDHGRLDDSYVWAHYFEVNSRHYVLLSNDYAKGSHLDDGMTHEIVKYNNESGIELKFNDNSEFENITGNYTLYIEKN